MASVLQQLQGSKAGTELLQGAQQQVQQCQQAYAEYVANHQLLTPENRYLEELAISDLLQQQQQRTQQAAAIAQQLHLKH